MDAFSRTFLPAAADAGLPASAVARHLPIFQRCADPDDAAVLVTRCERPEPFLRAEFVMVLTPRRLVITRESRFLRRLSLHLNTNVRHLSNVTWGPDARLTSFEVAATAIDGVRERFRVPVADPERVWHFDELFKHVFRSAQLISSLS